MALDMLFVDPMRSPVSQTGLPAPEIAALQELQDTLTRLHERVIRLRCENPPKVTRAQAFVYLEAQTNKLAARSVEAGGTESGWPDPGDVFAGGDQVDGLREAVEELTRPDAPYPLALPPGCWLLPSANFDVFAAGRLYNGKLSAGSEASVVVVGAIPGGERSAR